jgi:hypothetical protein
VTLGRRKFLGLFGVGAMAGPAAAKQLIESATAKTAGIASIGSVPLEYPQPTASNCHPGDGPKALRLIRSLPGLYDDYESAVFERERLVRWLDPDIAAKRSFSLAAKIAYQRQRNVAREIDAFGQTWDQSPWGRVDAIVRKALSPFSSGST